MIDRKDITNRLRSSTDQVIRKIERMSDEQLEKAAGGDFHDWMEDQISALNDWAEETCSVLSQCTGSDRNYRSGSVPKFIKNQEIQFYFDRKWWWGYIERIGDKNGGFTNNEFAYDIRRGDNVYTGICESNIKFY